MARMHTILRYGIQGAWSCERAGVWAGCKQDLGSQPGSSLIYLCDLGRVTLHL